MIQVVASKIILCVTFPRGIAACNAQPNGILQQRSRYPAAHVAKIVIAIASFRPARPNIRRRAADNIYYARGGVATEESALRSTHEFDLSYVNEFDVSRIAVELRDAIDERRHAR